MTCAYVVFTSTGELTLIMQGDNTFQQSSELGIVDTVFSYSRCIHIHLCNRGIHKDATCCQNDRCWEEQKKLEKDKLKKGLITQQQYKEPDRLDRKQHSRLFQYYSLESWIRMSWGNKEVRP